MKHIILILLCLSGICVKAQIAVSGSGTTTSVANNAPAIVVDNALTISTSYTIPGFRVRVSNNFSSGDLLAYTGSLPSGVSASYNSSNGILSFTGSSTALNYQTLLRTVTFRTTSSSTSTRTISFEAIDANTVYNSANGHFYAYVSGTYSWTGAKSNAAGRNFFGAQGYLATVTSASENTFILTLSGKGWLGGSDEFSQINAATGATTFSNQTASEGKWYWVTGPEKGTQFSNGSTVVTYANWTSGEPNNSSSTEHYLENAWATGGEWNDSQNTGSSGYILEYGGIAGDPSVDIFHTRNVLMIATQLKTITTLNPYTLRSPAIVVDPEVAVYSTGNITDAKVTISGNFKSGDALSYTGSLPGGVTSGYNSTTGVLSFTGTTSAANWQSLFRTVTFSSTSSVVGNRDVTFSVGNLVANSNGHFYESVSTGTTWPNAKTAAAAKTYMGLQGYLVTITSASENDFIKQKIGTDAWIGLSDAFAEINAATGATTYANQAAAEGKFYWISGPEKGMQVTTANSTGGSSTGAAFSGMYTNWNGGEPNNYGGSESYGEMYAVGSAPGRWNDLNGTQNLMYVVEYGGMSTDPMITLTANTTIVNNSVLPVTGLDLSLQQNINSINVKWSTLTELNCDRFEVLHSVDGVVFNKIASVKGHGNSDDKQFYLYNHQNPAFGINYYKLQQYDFDGKYKYSPVKQLNYGNAQTLLSPNPAHSKITIFHQGNNADESLIIYNMSGKVMHKTKMTTSKTYVDIQSLPIGLYLAEIKNRSTATRIMFVKQ